ncbi:MAG: glycosyltransferase family A protein [Gemmataceae bacterium]
MELTVAIPTYNRNRQLVETLGRLLPQLTATCRVVIFDNCSPTPVTESLADLLSHYPQAHVKIHRNRVNIGGNANVCRCFETCETEWLWVLGDDDPPLPDAVTRLAALVAAKPELVFANYSSNFFRRERSIDTVGLAEFMQHFDHFGNILSLSASLYRSAPILAQIIHGMNAAQSAAPQLAMLLRAIGDSGRCCLSEERLVEHAPFDAKNYWSLLDTGLSLSLLFEGPYPSSVCEPLGRALVRSGIQSQEAFAILLIYRALATGDIRKALYLYDQLFSRYYYFAPKLSRRIRTLAYRPMVRFPKLGLPVMRRLLGILHGRTRAEELIAMLEANIRSSRL